MSSRLKQQFLEELSSFKIIDGHSHRCSKSDYYQNHNDLNLFTLINIVDREIWSACGAGIAELIKDCTTDRQRWEIFKKVLSRIRNTSYWRHYIVTYQQLYDFKDDELTDDNWESLNEQIKTRSKDPAFYDYMIKDYCRIERSIQGILIHWIRDIPKIPDHADYFLKVLNVRHFTCLGKGDNMDVLQEFFNREITSLGILKQCLTEALTLMRDNGAVAIKFDHAYHRTLFHDNPSEHDAEVSFDKMISKRDETAADDIKPYQDYVVHHICKLAGELGLVVTVHTGMPMDRAVEWTNPLLLDNLICKYPEVKFNLFHAGLPYARELGILAKHRSNVYPDTCWCYTISPSISRQVLSEWIDLVPAYRIMGFGSDVTLPELVCGYLHMGRQIVADVLADKVERDFLGRDSASDLIKMMFRNNAVELFRLDERFGITKV